MEIPSQEWLSGFQNDLLGWFVTSKREFPWRTTSDPFKILIAEKLLQQTRVTVAVVAAYNHILNKFPTPANLASANLSELEEIIKPLGLTFRAKQLKLLAVDIQTVFGGKVPENFSNLMKLTGVGEYTARAVLSFTFHKDYAIIDTNVGRFLFRLYNIKRPFPANPSRKKYLVDKAQVLLPPGNSKNFNLAILDLCAEICIANIPKCYKCPVREYCQFDKKTF